MPLCRWTAVLCRIAVVATLGLAAAIGRAGPDYERWYTVDMMDQRAGWMMSSQATDATTITSRSKMKIAIRRGNVELPILFETEFIETLDHKPVSMRSIRRMGTMPVESAYVFGPTGVTVETVQGGPDKTVEQAPLPEGDWMTPAAAGDFAEARMKAGDQKIVVRTISPGEGLQIVEMTREVLSRTNIISMGQSIPAFRCRVTQNLVEIPSIEYVDEGGIPLRVETSMGAINLKMQAATREEATAETAAPEVMVSTFVKPDRRIPRARYKKVGVYTLTVPEGGTLADLPTAGAQRVERLDARSVRVRVDALNPQEATAEEARDPQFLGRSAMVDSADPEVAALAAQAVEGAGESPAARAEAIRRFVYTFIATKDLDVGFATATEVARTKRGDCTEHGVLLAAVLRAAGIPARVVSGLVYAEGFAGQQDIFGYHMWAQALLETDGKARWIDLDATLGETAFDATHIALAVTALGDDQTYQALAPMATMIGQLSIKVDSAE